MLFRNLKYLLLAILLHASTEKISVNQLAFFNQFVTELQHYKNNNSYMSTNYEVYRVVQKGLHFTQKPCGFRDFIEFTNKLFTAQSANRV